MAPTWEGIAFLAGSAQGPDQTHALLFDRNDCSPNIDFELQLPPGKCRSAGTGSCAENPRLWPAYQALGKEEPCP